MKTRVNYPGLILRFFFFFRVFHLFADGFQPLKQPVFLCFEGASLFLFAPGAGGAYAPGNPAYGHIGNGR